MRGLTTARFSYSRLFLRRDAPSCNDAPVTTPLGLSGNLAETTRQIELHVAGGGWDGPIRVFALVRAAEALAAEPNLVELLGPGIVAAAEADPDHLLSVEQEGLPEAATLEDLLAQLAWPETVAGVAVSVERVMLPPEAQANMPEDPDEAVAYLMAHPDRQDVRIVAAVLREGPTWCAVRFRANDDDLMVATGPDLVPGLLAALSATLAD